MSFYRETWKAWLFSSVIVIQICYMLGMRSFKLLSVC